MRIDLHTHSSVSDGTDTPTQLVHKAREAGLDVIALCDHDTFDGLMEAREAAKRVGVTVLPGMEMSCEIDGHTVHLLAYGADPYHRPLLMELAQIRVARSGRLERMADQLTAAGAEITVDDIMEQAGASPSVGRPHAADALVAKGYVATRDEAFEVYLDEGKPGYVSRYATPLAHAIDLIHDANGIAVIAHPWGRGRDQQLTAEVLAELVRDHELEGIEVEHEDHTPEQRELLFQLGERLGLIRTGSSDYHGTGKENHDLGCNLTRPSAYRDIVNKIKARGGIV